MRNVALTNSVALGLTLVMPVSAQQGFDTADAATQAVIDGATKHNGARLSAIFGARGNAILSSGNPAQDRAEQSEFSRLAGTKHRLIVDARNSNRVILSIGDQDWPFPIPIVRTNGKWSFDASEARVEMRARSIGAQELDVIEICAGYVDAQRKYASGDHGKDGRFQSASHMASAADDGGGLVPLVPQGLADATWDEQKNALKPYHGYFFRMLDGQGAHATGGAHVYRIKNKLMGGFGLVAWPAQYGVTGILTFIVNQDGEIYQKDIAPLPSGKVVPITGYDPDPTWKPVN